jgi:hypothetical protein
MTATTCKVIIEFLRMFLTKLLVNLKFHIHEIYVVLVVSHLRISLSKLFIYQLMHSLRLLLWLFVEETSAAGVIVEALILGTNMILKLLGHFVNDLLLVVFSILLSRLFVFIIMNPPSILTPFTVQSSPLRTKDLLLQINIKIKKIKLLIKGWMIIQHLKTANDRTAFVVLLLSLSV